VTSRPRRDFLLDSGGVSALAANGDLLVAYLELLRLHLNGALLIPIPVLTEVRSGHRRSDTLVDRLIKAIGAEGDIYAPLTVTAAARAGVLRTEALQLSRHDISTTDAQIVAIAEERSFVCAVTIVTGDPEDINLLVGLTRRTNIAVDVPGRSAPLGPALRLWFSYSRSQLDSRHGGERRRRSAQAIRRADGTTGRQAILSV
jgi:hypothetical protein